MSSKFPVVGVVNLGAYKTPEAYVQALESAGFKIGNRARDILKKVKCSKTKVRIRLASATVGQLGLVCGGTTTELYAAILAQGYQLCPSEVAPIARILYKDQPKGQGFWIAMEAISDSNGDLLIFDVGQDHDGLWLDSVNGRPDAFWPHFFPFVFVVPAQVSLSS